MEYKRILALISKKAGIILLFGLLIAAFSFFALLAKEKNYKVSTDYLIVQNQGGAQDFYTLSKSAEYIGKILNEAVYSELFIDEVIKTGKVNAEFLPFDKKEKLKQWSKIVEVSRNPDLGIIGIEIFENDQRKAVTISQSVVEVLTTKNSLFRGDGQNIDVKVLSGPVVEKNPSLANILATTIGGFILGSMLSVLYLVYGESRRKKSIFTHLTKAEYVESPINSSPLSRMETAGNFQSNENMGDFKIYE